MSQLLYLELYRREVKYGPATLQAGFVYLNDTHILDIDENTWTVPFLAKRERRVWGCSVYRPIELIRLRQHRLVVMEWTRSKVHDLLRGLFNAFVLCCTPIQFPKSNFKVAGTGWFPRF